MFDHNETLEEARVRNVRDALFEDVGVCDWTAQLVPAGQRVKARLLVREAAVLCGRDWFAACVTALDDHRVPPDAGPDRDADRLTRQPIFKPHRPQDATGPNLARGTGRAGRDHQTHFGNPAVLRLGRIAEMFKGNGLSRAA